MGRTTFKNKEQALIECTNRIEAIFEENPSLSEEDIEIVEHYDMVDKIIDATGISYFKSFMYLGRRLLRYSIIEEDIIQKFGEEEAREIFKNWEDAIRTVKTVDALIRDMVIEPKINIISDKLINNLKLYLYIAIYPSMGMFLAESERKTDRSKKSRIFFNNDVFANSHIPNDETCISIGDSTIRNSIIKNTVYYNIPFLLVVAFKKDDEKIDIRCFYIQRDAVFDAYYFDIQAERIKRDSVYTLYKGKEEFNLIPSSNSINMKRGKMYYVNEIFSNIECECTAVIW